MNLISTNLRTILEMSGSPAEMTLHLLLLEKDLHSCFGDKIKGLLKGLCKAKSLHLHRAEKSKNAPHVLLIIDS